MQSRASSQVTVLGAATVAPSTTPNLRGLCSCVSVGPWTPHPVAAPHARRGTRGRRSDAFWSGRERFRDAQVASSVGVRTTSRKEADVRGPVVRLPRGPGTRVLLWGRTAQLTEL